MVRRKIVLCVSILLVALVAVNCKSSSSSDETDSKELKWKNAPSDIVVSINSLYAQTNGVASDKKSQTLTCSSIGDTCSFNVTVGGTGKGKVNCDISFTAGAGDESCSVGMKVNDGKGEVVRKNVPIEVIHIFYVDSAKKRGTGKSWADALGTVQEAVDAASAGCEVWVKEGVYQSSDNNPVVAMKDGVEIYGGFIGDEATLLDRTTRPISNPTILDGNQLSYRVVYGSSNASLDGFLIQNNLKYGDGGGMYNYAVANLYVNNCWFSYNSAFYGGGMFNKNSTAVTVSNSLFNYNTAKKSGGGISNDSSTSTINNSVFKHNRANDGGGVAGYLGTTDINNSVFIFNSGSDQAGGVFNYDGSATISNSTFAHNHSDWNSGSSMATEYYSNGASTTVIRNSIMWGGSNAEISFNGYGYDSGSMTVSYSDVEGGYTGTGNINDDPLFVDGVIGNIHLQNTSPAIDAGDLAAQYNDIDGSRNDMGAYGGQTATNLDTDHDGMEDWWEDLMGLNKNNPADASGNPDGDTFTNLDEFNNGTDPFTSDIRFVDAAAPAGGDGLSWGTAYNHPQEAIDSESEPKAVLVAAGTYYSGTTGPVLTMKNKFSFYGGCVKTEALPADRVDPALNPSILDGGNLSAHVVIGAHDITLDGFTITGGNATVSGNGSGIYFNGKRHIAIANCIFVNNLTAANGGAIYFIGDELSITNSIFTGNNAYDNGGAIRISGSKNVSITDCTFQNNMTTNSGSWGGAIYFTASHITIANCVFTNNSAVDRGGVIYCYDDFSSNHGLIVNDSFFTGNSSTNGGVMYSSFTAPEFTNCVFIGNYAQNGGAVYDVQYSNKYTNCIFIGNLATSGDGGAIYSKSYADPVITNCTFSGNSATSEGGALYNKIETKPKVINSILWGNTAPSGPQIFNDGTSSTAVTYSDIESGHAGTGNIIGDPLFVTGANGDYYLSVIPLQGADSPCIDVGSDTAANLGMDTKTTRTDNATDTGIVDMGYHFEVP